MITCCGWLYILFMGNDFRNRCWLLLGWLRK